MTISTLETARLLPRPFTLPDAAAVAALAGDREAAALTLTIPHPYPADLATAWIEAHEAGAASGARFTFALARRDAARCFAASRSR